MERHLEQSHHAHHLSDEQLAGLLVGSKPAEVQEHLEVCSVCADEASQISSAIGSFQQQSRLWAERRAATQPMLVPVPASANAWLQHPHTWTAAAMIVALAVGLGAAARSHYAPGAKTQIAGMQPSPALSSSTLKADNDLLSAINGELQADDSTDPAVTYSLESTAQGARSHAEKRIIRE